MANANRLRGRILALRTILFTCLAPVSFSASGTASIDYALSDGEFIRDAAAILDTAAEAAAASRCALIHNETDVPVLVFTVTSTSPSDGGLIPLNAYSMALLKRLCEHSSASGRNWKKSILFLVSYEERKVRIELGPDWGHTAYEQAEAVRSEIVLPLFKKGRYEEGILEGLNGLHALAKGETLPMRPGFHFSLGYLIPIPVLLALGAALLGNSKGWFISKDALHTAAKAGRLQDAARLAKRGAPLSGMDKDGNTPMYYAARAGHFGMVKLLRDEGASPNLPDAPLVQALQFGHADVAKLLINTGARVDLPGRSGGTPLMSASRRADSELMTLLIQKGAKVDQRNESGRTAIFMAVESMDTRAVRLLIDSGADTNASTRDGHTPLIHATSLVAEDIVKLLLAHGADPNAIATNGESPLTEAVLQDNDVILSMLMDAGGDVSRKVDVFVSSDACESTETASNEVSTFTEKLSPYELAERFGHRKVALLLKRRSSKPQAPQARMDILDAVNCDDLKRVKAILRKKPHRIEWYSKDSGWGPLHLAVKNRNVGMVELLLKSGARVDRKNKRGKTPLHQAAELGDGKIVRLLLQHGADPSATYKDKTPLDRAMDYGHGDVVEVLKNWRRRPKRVLRKL
jgi:ankyrin repeat protein